MSEKLQKVLARAGLGSRREMERWISDGRIEVNGKPATLGDRVKETRDRIAVDGRLLKQAEPQATRVLAYHKPVGEICTRDDPEGRTTVFENLPKLQQSRWLNIGRLDINTSGLLLFTNNGELAHQLTHPSKQVEREYAVRVLGTATEEVLKQLTQGVQLEDGFARFEHIVNSGGRGANHWYHVVVTEGRNRVVRRLWESQNMGVSRLMRVRFGPIFLESSLRVGKMRELKAAEVQRLLEA